MYIKKESSKVVHYGYLPSNADMHVVRPTHCGNSGWAKKWYPVNPEVIEGIRKGSVTRLRLCKKCFKE